MVNKVKGSAIDLGDLGIAHSVYDYGGRITNTSGQNDTAIATALSAIATAGGGVLVIPHGVLHTFDPDTDFPVTANALMVWILQGSNFKIYSNQNLAADLGETFASAFFDTPSAIEYKIVDADPPTYTYKFKVYNNGGSPVISGSSYDLCVFLPGGTNPVAAFARNGSKLGALYLFNGLDVTGVAEVDELLVTGQARFSKEIVVPVAAGSTQIADTTSYLILNHTGTIASHTITLPQVPKDGHVVQIFSLNAITTLTLAAGTGESIETGHGITTIGAAGSVEYMYNLATTKWYRVR